MNGTNVIKYGFVADVVIKEIFMKKAKVGLILAIAVVVLGFVGCASVSDVDPFKGTTWGMENSFSDTEIQGSANGQNTQVQLSQLSSAIKFRNNGTVVSGIEAYPYKVYKTKNGYQAKWEKKLIGVSLDIYFNIDGEDSEEAYMDMNNGGQIIFKKMKGN